MKIALLGYGKMGKEIEKIALADGHEVVCRISRSSTEEDLNRISEADVAIEFSAPDTAFSHVKKCFSLNIPVVCGSTGWNEELEQAKEICISEGKSFFYASNFSVGVNIFFRINEMLARLMDKQDEYSLRIEETHHLQKKDYPSGTAISLARGIIDHSAHKNNWKATLKNEEAVEDPDVLILSKREDCVPGTHLIRYSSDVDTIEISHTAHNRKGFAAGAVRAAEWLDGKQGFFGMNDMLLL